MQKLGSFLVIIGLLSIVAGFFNYVPKILIWIYKWGDGAAWGIKIGLIVVGALCYMLSAKTEKN
ncbi:hypothetical protein [Chitinophaga solisilvae]|uniref:Uncharacterized protein n=1 Tax=Chitinophaga solisilvae TaxID=1233460 RepID=A0A433WBP3_9BACT|nr:hypothetical protein [Chitinophaga solisilvae]NSL85293.1 hypothetical protein [Chitinophaga solisilvae]